MPARAAPAPLKRGPSVLVTDSRDRPARGKMVRQDSAMPGHMRKGTQVISVDHVNQYVLELPSQQARGPPGRKPVPVQPRRDPRRSSVGTNIGTRVAQQNVPGRTTKVSEKLVLLPETETSKEQLESDSESEERPLRDDEMEELKAVGRLRGKSYAERLPKAKRTDKLARVTAYCTAQGYKLQSTAAFTRENHAARTKLYDDCLYTVYHLPLLSGNEGYRIRSSPVLKSPGGRSVLDEQIERSERRVYHEGYFEDTETYGVRGSEFSPQREHDQDGARSSSDGDMGSPKRPGSPNRIAPDITTFGEMFVFSYGVVVFWNFTERQEKDILADLTFSAINTGISLVSRPQEEADFETEEFHFEYNAAVERPRVFNDMITLRSGDHMIKLAISHAIAQSTKLSFFEERMSQTMLDAQHVPKRLALSGELGMSRKEIVMILGQLFKSRVDVNLSSNILDVPDFFWNSEPTLHPLYFAVREYLEIAPRAKVLNERCRVFLDLAEILSDSIADTKMSTITWIIIILIVVSIGVTVTEVGLRFAIIQKERLVRPGPAIIGGRLWNGTYFSENQVQEICGASIIPTTFDEL